MCKTQNLFHTSIKIKTNIYLPLIFGQNSFIFRPSDNNNSIFFVVPEQIAVIRREHFNRWYNTASYYAATLVSALPTQIVSTLTFACITYLMTGQPIEIIRFLIYCCTLLLVTFVALCMGLFNGSMFNIKVRSVPFFQK